MHHVRGIPTAHHSTPKEKFANENPTRSHANTTMKSPCHGGAYVFTKTCLGGRQASCALRADMDP